MPYPDEFYSRKEIDPKDSGAKLGFLGDKIHTLVKRISLTLKGIEAAKNMGIDLELLVPDYELVHQRLQKIKLIIYSSPLPDKFYSEGGVNPSDNYAKIAYLGEKIIESVVNKEIQFSLPLSRGSINKLTEKGAKLDEIVRDLEIFYKSIKISPANYPLSSLPSDDTPQNGQ